MADSAHKTKMTSWITVGLIVVACILLGIAMIAQSVPLAVVGGLMLVVGVVLGITGKIMEEVH
jgi:xanthine/uracil permease